MNGLIPPGYTARFLGSATTYLDLNTYYPLEEGMAEGSLMLMQLDFEEFLSSVTLESLNQALLDAGVPPWPGNNYIITADVTKPIIYLQWVKGMAFMTIIIGVLLTTVLPVLLGGLIWLVLPQEVKDLIVMMGFMLIFLGMFQMLKPMLTESKK